TKPAPTPPTEEEFADYESMKKRLEEQRRQIEEDEDALMSQMRQMELALSKDRAEVARQRSELERLNADLTREIELAARDPGLREKLITLQRRQQTIAKAGVASKPPQSPPGHAGAPAPPPAKSSGAKKSSGLIRRLFGN